MKRFLIGLIFSITAPASSLAQSAQAVPGEFIVKYKSTSSSSSVAKVRTKLAMKSASVQKAFAGMGMYHISLKAQAGEAQNLEDIKNDPDVEFVEPNYIFTKVDDASSSNNAQLYVYQSSYTYNEVLTNNIAQNDNLYHQAPINVGVTSTWSQITPVSPTNKVVVAVVDTGLDKNHTFFKSVANGGSGALWVNTREYNGTAGVDDDQNGYVDDVSGWNFISNTNNFLDDDDHGTHVAGIIAGVAQNMFARPLQESPIQIMPLKFLDANGSGTTAAAINAIYYAVNNGAKVINNSWGGPNYSRSLHEALAYAYDQQVLIVTAAGNYHTNNDSSDYPMYPANYDVPSNIAVASASQYDTLSNFSNYGANLVHVASPGERIFSTLPGDVYGYMDGTSMAAPFVAGMAAMALREAPNMTGYQLKQAVMNSVDVRSSYNGLVSTSGRINANALIVDAKNAVATVSSYQPEYKAQLRGVASDSGGSAGGCGLVSTAIHNGPGNGQGPTPMAGVMVGLMALPLAVWFVLRRRDPKHQRKHERFRMSSQIRVMVGDKELVGSMNTISQGGLSFNTEEALEKGGIITMRITSPDGHEMIEVQGQVVWSEQNQAYGVQFANARQGTLAMIQQWTQNLVKS
ncbi:S8 family serine peptidase [Bdellovibrio sp. NC01]|uniref:S8 family serine peptidase n=1 Tax=Bdellovibrio sp. NC01 TaxID=2220073 RepID=UPI0011580A2B|nr:S8 family serine peptidase [Bdellovibrio sp. NC01]QDK38369.1 serine protease [Bdellovibrio sp. NC01]